MNELQNFNVIQGTRRSGKTTALLMMAAKASIDKRILVIAPNKNAAKELEIGFKLICEGAGNVTFAAIEDPALLRGLPAHGLPHDIFIDEIALFKSPHEVLKQVKAIDPSAWVTLTV